MPEATTYPLNVDSKAWQTLETAYRNEQGERNKTVEQGWNYYNGKHRQPLKKQSDGHDDNVIVNDIEILANKLVAFLIGDGVKFDAGGDDQEGDADQDIKDLWQANRDEIFIDNLALSGIIEGHCAVLLLPQPPIEGNETPAFPRLVRVQQKHFAAFWDPFDVQYVLWYRLQTLSGGVGRRIDYVRGGIDEAERGFNHALPFWSELVWESKRKGTAGSPLGTGKDADWKLTGITPWGYPWPPIVDWQNMADPNRYYGRNDISSAIKLNDSLNFILSNVMRIIKHYADPKSIGIGFSVDELIPSQVGGFFTVNKPRSEADIYNLEMQSDGALSRWLAGLISESLWQSGGMIDPQAIKDRVGQLTNFGLQVLYTDAIKKTGKKRLLYEEGFEMINKRALELAGLPVPASITTVWPDVLPEDQVRQTEVLERELAAGIISKETFRERRGYDNKQEEGRLIEEQENNPNPLAGLLTGQGFNNAGFNRGA